MANALKVLAYVPGLDPQTKANCGFDFNRKTKSGEFVQKEARWPYFALGYVDNDLPRDAVDTQAIVAAVEAYAVGDANGHILREFKSLSDAEAARASAEATEPIYSFPPELMEQVKSGVN